MESSGDGWSAEGVDGFGATAIGADFGIVNEDDFDFRSVRHFGDGIGVPIARSDAAFIEHSFFVECVADAHRGATFDLAFQLCGIDDDARIHGDCVFFHDDRSGAASDSNFADELLRATGPAELHHHTTGLGLDVDLSSIRPGTYSLGGASHRIIASA